MQEQGKHTNRIAGFAVLLIAVALVSSGVTAFFCGLWGGGAWAPLAQMADTIARVYYYYDEKVGGEDALIDAATSTRSITRPNNMPSTCAPIPGSTAASAL